MLQRYLPRTFLVALTLGSAYLIGGSSALLFSLPLVCFLLFAPLLYLGAVAVLGTFMATTVLVFHIGQSWERERLQLRFHDTVVSLEQQIEKAVGELLSTLTAIENFYLSSEFVDRNEFKSFVTPFVKTHPGIQALEWIPLVKDEQRTEFEALARADGLKDFKFTERSKEGAMVARSKQSEYFPVFYAEPIKGNEKAIGFDLASNPARLKALSKARQTDQAIATEPITLVQEAGKQAGFLVFHPIFNEESKLLGFSLGVFRVQALISNLLATLPTRKNFDISIYDSSAPKENALLYSSLATERDSRTAWESDQILIAGRPWKLNFWPTQSFFSSNKSDLEKALFLGGFSLNAMIAVLLFILSLRISKTEQLIAQRTAKLNETNQDLQAEIEKTKMSESALAKQRAVAFNIAEDARLAKQEAEQNAKKFEIANTELERSNSDLDQFAYVASHDLKAPLRAISNYAEWISEDCADVLPAKSKEHLDKLKQRILKMESLLDDLLSYSRVGRKEGASQEVNTTDMVAEIIELLSEPSELDIVVSDKLPTIMTPREPLAQVFRNLIGNAVKYHDKNDGWVKITTQENGSCCEFVISDNGPGIDPEYHSKIFEMFQTLQSSNKGSTGMGLALVKKIVESRGGKIEVESEKGKGALFRFTWPI